MSDFRPGEYVDCPAQGCPCHAEITATNGQQVRLRCAAGHQLTVHAVEVSGYAREVPA